MLVFKFGGASVKDSASIRRVANIIGNHAGQPLVVVISAMGKTTNALEAIAAAWFQQTGEAEVLFDALEKEHRTIARELFRADTHPVFEKISALCASVREHLSGVPGANFDFHYDQIVSVGELLSTTIISAWLNEAGLAAHWLDVREVLKTDDAHREAKVHWSETEALISSRVSPLLKTGIVVTQGFIGKTIGEHTTTLGREGSDFTAAVFSSILQPEKMVIWKDVPGVLNADPRYFEQTKKIGHLSYYEAIEMTYYGAKVIHPKTIKPLQNRSIPLHVNSFFKPAATGTVISDQQPGEVPPPVIVLKKNQVLLSLSTKDFSFMAEENLSVIYGIFAQLRVRINMMQTAALSFSVCVDAHPQKIDALEARLHERYHIKSNRGLELLTIRHYNDRIIRELLAGREQILAQKSRTTVQFAVREQ